ncbi:glycosyltransferase [Microbacterium sp. 179-B 1A2 NHS]|uniref:glycosyltransferase n=1 Tax=Microbacterium sp. 179-B 1A2 NHS TaxID=3142383 RepID=UPI0039A0FD9C
MSTRIGWYVHHHGRGHLTRLRAIAPRIDAEIDCFSSLPAPPDLPSSCRWTVLPRDDDASPGGPQPAEADPTVRGLLHWAPRGHAGHRDRLAAIAAASRSRPVDAFVVDVSVEVTLLVRLLGVPPVVFTQPGVRDDEPHRLGFAAAQTVVAPWPGDILAPPHLSALGDRVVYTGGISRFEDRMTDGAPDRTDDVVLLAGAGGTAVTPGEIAAAAASTRRPWRALGAAAGSWQEDPWDAITTAGVVIAWAGQNSIADLAAAGAPAIVVPQERPFDEQQETGRALRRAELAVVVPEWPDAASWPALLDRAATSRPSWEHWQVAGATRRAAEAILQTARGER